MKASEISKRVEDLVIVYSDTLLAFIDDLEKKLLRQLMAAANKLELDDEGYILQTSANRKIIQEAEKVFNDVIKSSSYQKAISDFMKVIDEVDKNNVEYFSSVSKNFKPNKAFISNLRKNTFKSVETLLLQEGLDIQVKLPLLDVMTQNINTAGLYSGMVKQLNKFIDGDGNGGVLKNHVRVVSTGAVMDYSRAYQQSVASSLNLEFYLYSGDLIRNSRDFCVERAGHYFHHKEIEEMSKLSWSGKHKATTEASIFIYAGGYGCTHSIVPVGVDEVPDEVIERARNEGYI